MNNHEGPSMRNIPAQKYKVCHGCKYLEKQAMLRGHKSVTDNYSCAHPDIVAEEAKRKIHSIFNSDGRLIYFNHSGDCITPDWCPYANKYKSSGTED